MNFIGLVRIGKDAIMGTTPSGKQVCNFSVAFNSGWGENKHTIWLDCSGWGERYIKLAPFITKGKQIVVCGDLGQRERNGKTYLTLDVKDVELCNRQGERDSGEQQSDSSRPPVGGHTTANKSFNEKAFIEKDFMDDDIPF